MKTQLIAVLDGLRNFARTAKTSMIKKAQVGLKA